MLNHTPRFEPRQTEHSSFRLHKLPIAFWLPRTFRSFSEPLHIEADFLANYSAVVRRGCTNFRPIRNHSFSNSYLLIALSPANGVCVCPPVWYTVSPHLHIHSGCIV